MQFKRKPEELEHKPIEALPEETIVLLWVDSYDCGWVCDIGWKATDGTLFVSQRGGSIKADMPYTLWSKIRKPKEQQS